GALSPLPGHAPPGAVAALPDPSTKARRRGHEVPLAPPLGRGRLDGVSTMTTPSAAPAPPLALRRLPAEARADAAATWQALEAAAAKVPVSASWLWTETWLRHY